MMNDVDLTAQQRIEADIDAGLSEALSGSADMQAGITEWMALARNAYESSTDFLDANIRTQWEKSIAHQNSEHAPGSKYHSDAYRLRSKVFRPKTRANNLGAEAAVARAMFSTNEVVNIAAEDNSNPAQVISAEINQALLQYRLTKTIPWYLTALGAFQDARVYGVCASYQGWLFETAEMDGIEVITRDQPWVENIPPENLRFDASADWRDPVSSSPYMIRLVPIFIGDFSARARANSWPDYTPSELLAAVDEQRDDTTRQQRQGTGRTDPAAHDGAENAHFRQVWLHENFIRKDGIDWVFWTVGTKLPLGEPMPVSQAYPHLRHGERPIVVGITLIETHKTYPASPTRLMEPLQEQSNHIANQRMDNVALVLNKRYLVRRGQTGLDLAALSRSVPGGAVLTSNPDQDVRVLETPDVTGSSYAEQDRVDLTMDEISGSFSQQTVQNNRNLNETVGGMEMMNAGANAITEYQTKTWIETWVEPVIRQLVRLEQMYESDQTALALAAKSAEQDMLKFGINEITDDLLRQELAVSVSVGFGATNPTQRLQQFNAAMQSVAFLPNAIARLDEDQVIKEVFGYAGFRDGSRFFKPLDDIQQQGPQIDPIKQMEVELRAQQFQFEQQFNMAKLQADMEYRYSDLAARENLKLSELQAKLGIEDQRIGLETQREQNKRQIEGTRLMNEQAKLAMQNANLQAGYDTF